MNQAQQLISDTIDRYAADVATRTNKRIRPFPMDLSMDEYDVVMAHLKASPQWELRTRGIYATVDNQWTIRPSRFMKLDLQENY